MIYVRVFRLVAVLSAAFTYCVGSSALASQPTSSAAVILAQSDDGNANGGSGDNGSNFGNQVDNSINKLGNQYRAQQECNQSHQICEQQCAGQQYAPGSGGFQICMEQCNSSFEQCNESTIQ